MPGIEPGAFHMQSERATTALHPPLIRRGTRGNLTKKRHQRGERNLECGSLLKIESTDSEACVYNHIIGLELDVSLPLYGDVAQW